MGRHGTHITSAQLLSQDTGGRHEATSAKLFHGGHDMHIPPDAIVAMVISLEIIAIALLAVW